MDYRDTMPNANPNTPPETSQPVGYPRMVYSYWMDENGDWYEFKASEMHAGNQNWVNFVTPTIAEPAPELEPAARYWFPDDSNPNEPSDYFTDYEIVEEAKNRLHWTGLTPEEAGEKLHCHADWSVIEPIIDENGVTVWVPKVEDGHWVRATQEEIDAAQLAMATTAD